VIVRRQDLDLGGVPLSTGGQGEVYPAGPVTARLVGSSVPVVVKRYIATGAILPEGLVELDRRSEWLRGLDPKSRAEVLTIAAWPLAAVEDGGRLWGVVMEDLGTRFGARMDLPSGARKHVLTRLEHLLEDDDYLARRFHASFSTATRTRLAERIALAMVVLHRHAIVASDVSHANVLLDLDPPYQAAFIDCDSMVFQGRVVLKEVETPGWELPPDAGERPETRTADAYKLALAFLRIYRRSPSATWSAATAVAPTDAILTALERALGGKQRATPGAWVELLRGAAGVEELVGAVPAPRPAPPPVRPVPPPPVRPAPVRPAPVRPARRPAPVGGPARPVRRRRPVRRWAPLAAAVALAAVFAWVAFGSQGGDAKPGTPTPQPTTVVAGGSSPSGSTRTRPRTTRPRTKARARRHAHHAAGGRHSTTTHPRTTTAVRTPSTSVRQTSAPAQHTVTSPRSTPAATRRPAQQQRPSSTGAGLSGSQSAASAGGGLSGSASGDGGGGLSGDAGP
jgi:hypothetical protein